MFKRDDWIFGLLSLCIGGFVLCNIGELRSVASMDPAGPSALPSILSWFMIVIGAVHVVASLLLIFKGPSFSTTGTKKSFLSIKPVFLIVAVSSLYIFFLPVAGYPVATPLLLISVMFITGVRDVKKLLCTSLFTTVVLFASFFYGLNVKLPLGMLENLF